VVQAYEKKSLTSIFCLAPTALSHVRAWGIAPGSNCHARNQALKARFNLVNALLIPNAVDMNRAFSAGVFFAATPGAAPQAENECRAFGGT
jgi:hypothetical protein